MGASIVDRLLPRETASRRAWEWGVAARAMKPLLRDVRTLHVSERVRARIAYDAEAAIRAVLGDAGARARLAKSVARLDAKDAKRAVDAWVKGRVELGVERAKRVIERSENDAHELVVRIARMDARALHRFATRWNWDEGASAMDAVVRHPRCALGTALLVYWLAKPYWYAQWASPKSADDPEVAAMLLYIEARIARGGYRHEGIAFDPRADGLTTARRTKRRKRPLPPHVFAATTATSVVRFPD